MTKHTHLLSYLGCFWLSIISAHAGSVTFQELEAVIKSNPDFDGQFEAMKIDDNGEGQRLGRHYGAVAGARVGPYKFGAAYHGGTNDGQAVDLVLHTSWYFQGTDGKRYEGDPPEPPPASAGAVQIIEFLQRVEVISRRQPDKGLGGNPAPPTPAPAPAPALMPSGENPQPTTAEGLPSGTPTLARSLKEGDVKFATEYFTQAYAVPMSSGQTLEVVMHSAQFRPTMMSYFQHWRGPAGARHTADKGTSIARIKQQAQGDDPLILMLMSEDKHQGGEFRAWFFLDGKLIAPVTDFIPDFSFDRISKNRPTVKVPLTFGTGSTGGSGNPDPAPTPEPNPTPTPQPKPSSVDLRYPLYPTVPFDQKKVDTIKTMQEHVFWISQASETQVVELLKAAGYQMVGGKLITSEVDLPVLKQLTTERLRSYVAVKGDDVVICFRGSLVAGEIPLGGAIPTVLNGLTDANVNTTNPSFFSSSSALTTAERSVRVHQGFDTAYQRLRPQIMAALQQHSGKKVYVFGHSLGAAQATLCALDLAINAAGTFQTLTHLVSGSPRVGDQAFRTLFEKKIANHFRIAIQGDPVAMIPKRGLNGRSIVQFVHAGRLLQLGPDGVLIKPKDITTKLTDRNTKNHANPVYRQAVGELHQRATRAGYFNDKATLPQQMADAERSKQ